MGNYFSYLYEIENNEIEQIDIKEEISEKVKQESEVNFLTPIKYKYRKPPELEWDYDGIDLISDIDYKEKYNMELKKYEILNDKYLLLLYKYNFLLNKKND